MEDRFYRTICQFCHTNCGIIVRRDAEGAIAVAGDPEHPMNRGRCCIKAGAILRSSDRRIGSDIL